MREVEGLDHEVVVQAETGSVVGRIVQDDLGEGHIAHRQVEGVPGQAGVLESLGPDLGVGVQGGRHPGRGRVELDSYHVEGEAGRGQADEVAAAAAWLQHQSAAEAEGLHRVPHLQNHLGGGVVRIEDGPPCRLPGLVVEAAAYLGAELGPVLVGGIEHARQRPPARPAGQDRLFLRARWPALLGQHIQHVQGGDVGPGLGP